jgi:hypothetical protein
VKKPPLNLLSAKFRVLFDFARLKALRIQKSFKLFKPRGDPAKDKPRGFFVGF